MEKIFKAEEIVQQPRTFWELKSSQELVDLGWGDVPGQGTKPEAEQVYSGRTFTPFHGIAVHRNSSDICLLLVKYIILLLCNSFIK